MLLAKPKDVLLRIGLAESQDRLATVISTLEGVKYKIEADLRTSLDRNVRTDYFSVQEQRVLPKSLLFHTSQGFIDASQTFELRVFSSGDIADNLADSEVIDPTAYEIDFTKGRITLRDQGNIFYGHEVYQFSYTAGFALTSSDEIDDAVVPAPTWLKQGALAATVIELNAQNFSRQKTKNNNNTRYDINLANHSYTSIINSQIRTRSSGIHPARGVIA